MSTHVQALKDEELVHYAGIDQDAAEELARRLGLGLAELPTLEAEMEPIREEIRHLEDQIGAALTAISCIRKIIASNDPQAEKDKEILARLKQLEDDL